MKGIETFDAGRFVPASRDYYSFNIITEKLDDDCNNTNSFLLLLPVIDDVGVWNKGINKYKI